MDQNNEMERSDYVCRAIVRHELLVDVFVLAGARIGLAPEQGRLGEAWNASMGDRRSYLTRRNRQVGGDYIRHAAGKFGEFHRALQPDRQSVAY